MSIFVRRSSAVCHNGSHKIRNLVHKPSVNCGFLQKICLKILSAQQYSSSKKRPAFSQKKPSFLDNYTGLCFKRTFQKRRYSKEASLLKPTDIFKCSISCLHSPRKNINNAHNQKCFIHTVRDVNNIQSQKPYNNLLLLILAVVAVTAVLLAASTDKAEAQEAELFLEPLSKEELTLLADSLGISSFGLDCDSLRKLCFQVLVEACIKEEWSKISVNKSLVARLTDISGKTLFLRMIDEGRKKQVEYLIQMRLEYRYCDSEGNNGLHLAAANGYAPLIPLLIEKFKGSDTNKMGKTAFHLAIENGHAHIVGILVERVRFTPWISPEGIAYSSSYLAIQSGDIETVDKVLKENPKQLLDAMPPEIGTVLHLAIKTRTSESCPLLKHLLTRYHKETEFLLNQVDREDRTPLHLAAFEGVELAIDFLITKKHVPVNQANSRGRTAVHWAALGEQPDAITRLYYHEADLMQGDYQHRAPLLLLSGKKSLEATQCAALLETLAVQINREKDQPQDYTKRPPKHIVFQGGGAKGIAYVGIIKALEDLESMGQVTHVAGTSAGAITATLVAVGYNSQELNRELALKDFEEFLDPVSSMHAGILQTMKTGNMIPAITSILKDYWTGTSSLNPIAKAKALNNRLLETTGLCKSTDLHKWVEERVYKATNKKHCTFRELHDLVGQNPDKYKDLYVYATCLKENNKPEIKTFSWEDEIFQDVVISDAVCASASIPGIFEPYVLQVKNSPTDTRHERKDLGRYVDGGLINNLPIKAFDDNKYQNEPKQLGEKTNRRTLGFRLETSKNFNYNLDKAPDVVKAVLDTFYHAEDLLIQDDPHNKNRIVSIPVTVDIPLSRFGLTPEEQSALIKSADKALRFFLKTPQEL